MRSGRFFLGITLLVLSAVSTQVLAEDILVPNSRLGTRIAPLLLLRRPDVQSDVGLNPTQAAELDQISRNLYGRAMSLARRRDPEAEKARRSIDHEQQQWLKTRLTDEQKKRLVQIDLQWEGPTSVYSRATVAEALGLTTEQREVLKRVGDEFTRKRRENPSQPVKEGELTRQILAVLSEPQRELWKDMLGAPFVPQIANAAPATPAATPRARR